jgi:hypothetical protein
MKRAGIRKIATAAALCMPFLAVAQTQMQTLSLKRGAYVQMTYECVGAPKSVTIFWDGTGFSAEQTSKCNSDLKSTDGRQFQVSTTCAARTDGSADTAGRLEPFTLLRQSSDRFQVVPAGKPGVTYRWCGLPK